MPPLDPNQFPPPYLPTGGPTTEQLRQRALDAPAFSQQAVDISETIRQNFEALSSITSEIATNLGSVDNLMTRNKTNLDRTATSYERLNRASNTDVQHQIKLAETTKAREAITRRIKDAESQNVDSLRQQFRLGDMMTKRGTIKYVDKGALKEATPQEYLDLPEAQRQAIREQLVQKMATQEDPRFKIGEALQNLAHGNIGAALGEAFQSFSFTGRFTEPLMRRGESMRSRADALAARQEAAQLQPGFANTSMLGRLARSANEAQLGMRAGAMTGVGELLGTALPKLFTPAAIYGIQRELRQGLRSYQSDLRQGMQGGLTGGAAVRESVGAGLRARLEAINPFDALTTQMAQEIARGIQSEGFTGTVRAAWQDSVTDVVKRTGMDAGQALQLMSTAANQLGENANQFRGDMALVETTARQTSVSVNQAAQSMQALQQAFFVRGGQPATAQAASLSTTLTRALPRAVTTRGTLATAIAQNWQMIVARAGINPAEAFMPSVLSKSAQILDRIAAQLWQWKNRVPEWQKMSLQDWVTQMEGFNPGFFEALLPGASNADIVAFMNRSKGGGFERTRQADIADEARARARTVHQHHGLFGRFIRSVTGAAFDVNAAVAGAADSAVSAVTGHRTHVFGGPERQRLNDYLNNDIDLQRTRQNLIQSFINQIQDLTPGQQRQVLAPLRQATSYDELVGDAATKAQTIYIKMHPNASHWFNAEPANIQRYYDSTRGRSGTQGLVRPVK